MFSFLSTYPIMRCKGSENFCRQLLIEKLAIHSVDVVLIVLVVHNRVK